MDEIPVGLFNVERIEAGEPRGVVDQCIEPAQPRVDVGEHAPDLIDALEIGLKQVGASALGRCLLGFSFGGVVVNGDAVPLAREPYCDAAPDALRRAGDKDPLLVGQRTLSPQYTEQFGMKPAKKRLTDEELSAMRDRMEELKGGKTDGETELRAKIAALPQPDRALAERVHAIVMANAPALSPRTWYGMPAWARDGNVICFFQSAQKFKTRYATLGFSDKANLDDGRMWPTAFALKELTPAEEARIAALVKKAVS